ncbi:MAG TPA: SDR family oxidoreductase [Verrucomicrobiae bacterium]|nr:SDR family oxidoreductase [Verrucomicrobiae bacterium]
MSSFTRSLEGGVCVITGATSGIGRATAVALSGMGANLALIGRREEVGIKLAAKLRSKPGAGQVEFFRADLSDQRQMRNLGAAIASKYPRIDVLINNAGAKFDSFQQSVDGIELTFATNYLGHFLLAALLIDPLLRAEGARVITLGSGAHGGISAEGDWCLGPRNYDRKLAYGKSKLADIMFAYELARRLNGTSAVSNAVDPGGVATNLGRNNGLLAWCRHLAYYALKRQLISSERGAETVVFLATDAAIQGVTGKYFFEKRMVESSASSHDRQAAQRLWARSLELTHLGDWPKQLERAATSSSEHR